MNIWQDIGTALATFLLLVGATHMPKQATMPPVASSAVPVVLAPKAPQKAVLAPLVGVNTPKVAVEEPKVAPNLPLVNPNASFMDVAPGPAGTPVVEPPAPPYMIQSDIYSDYGASFYR